MKNKIITIVLTLTICMISSYAVFGTENTDALTANSEKNEEIEITNSEYDLLQTPNVLSKKNIEETEELSKSVEEYLENKITTKSSGGKTLSVSTIKQNNGHYCGPACIDMVMNYFGTNYTQSYIAQQCGTNNSGTIVYKIRNFLNSKLNSSHQYKYVYTSQIHFSQGLIYSIDKNRPVICHTKTNDLSYYNGHISWHYILARGYYYGYNNSGGTYYVKLSDPNNNNAYYGRHIVTYSEINNAINGNAGLYIMGK